MARQRCVDGIPFVPVYCPACASRNTRVRSTQLAMGGKRWHLCRDCQATFKSHELSAEQVQRLWRCLQGRQPNLVQRPA